MNKHNVWETPFGRAVSFPFAPQGWQADVALRTARAQGMVLGREHFELLAALQEYFARHEKPERNMRELHDALDERFHTRGGMRHLYQLFAGGPVAQGCRLAGLPVPAGAADKSFGSVQ